MELASILRIGELFQEYTKYKHFTKPSDMSLGKPIPNPEKSFDSNLPRFDLPDGEKALSTSSNEIKQIFKNRRSRRNYSAKSLTIEQLAALLWATQGLIEHDYGYSYRTAPSAGARHPLETYLNINNVEGLKAGLYRYLPFQHQLLQLEENKSISLLLTSACLDQKLFTDCVVSFIWTAVIDRSRWKYQQRSYRYIHLDAGHVCQNLYLACEALGLGCCAVAAFDDDAVNEIIGVDGKEEFVIYLATVGCVD